MVMTMAIVVKVMAITVGKCVVVMLGRCYIGGHGCGSRIRVAFVIVDFFLMASGLEDKMRVTVFRFVSLSKVCRMSWVFFPNDLFLGVAVAAFGSLVVA